MSNLSVPPQDSTLIDFQDREQTFKDTLAHAQAGYDNAQSVIKLIDAKAGVLISLSTLAAGFLVTVLKWYIELDPSTRVGAKLLAGFANNPWHACLIFLGAKYSLFAGVTCIVACVWSVIARSRERLINKPLG